MYIIFDTETTGLPKNFKAPISDLDNWPRVIQIAWQVHDQWGNLVEAKDYLIYPEGFDIPYDSERIHGISTALAKAEGKELNVVLDDFNRALQMSKFVVGQNVGFDVNVTGAEFLRAGIESPMTEMPVLDTCTETTASLCKITGGRGGKFKLPTLTELHEYLFGEAFAEAHNATADVEATTRCFLELIRRKTFSVQELQQVPGYLDEFTAKNPTPIRKLGLQHINLKKASEEIRKKLAAEEPEEKISEEKIEENLATLEKSSFAHLHNHSQFSILQSTMSVKQLVEQAATNKMPAVALTDHANMMGAFHFVSEASKHNKAAEVEKAKAEEEKRSPQIYPIKPIVGCEFFVCEDHTNKNRKDNGYQVVFLAKNKNGYHNLAKMSSKAYTDGFYYVPRIDKQIIETYKEDIIVLSGNLYGEVPSKILNLGEKQAEEALVWWKSTFGDDFYIELMRHQQEDEDRANQALIKLAQKHEVKLVATNNTYYANQEDANAHDILLCVKDGEKQATPKGRGRGYRYGLPNDEYYFKSEEEMKELFKDLPEAITNTEEIVNKVEAFDLHRDVLLPAFDIPDEFKDAKDKEDKGKRGENAYLRHITYLGAKKRYGEITEAIQERLDFELEVIANTGYPGYFLIVEDFIREARKMGVSVGPGRGSAAGSAVAYCLKITNIDPIQYDLLFERFLNPERVSMPDIDIDFDDEGRSKVMDYVIEKYGANQVAQIITYGTMAAKSAIRDTARALDLPLYEADRIAKLVPDMSKLSKIFGKNEKELRSSFRSEDVEKVLELISISEDTTPESETVNQARILEGSVRNTGIHACGVIITPDDITKFVPVALAKDSELYVTQFDNSVVEDAGLLKMDFLGLKTLTLIKDTVEIVKGRHGVELDPESFPLDDVATYELFQRGETVGIFQYESPGMQKYMKELKPTVFEDLIAMNALYRPGPMEYIPSFIARKHGKEEISYDLPAMEEYLEETYGITVYQEQVMLLSQKLANFTKGEADILRKAMGKKLKDVLAQLKPKFIGQAKDNGHDEEKLEKIWKDWEAFASYAFNKSHSTCYAWIAYQTAYLKAHYPAEYMAAVLSNNMSDIKKVSFFMEECKRMGLKVLGPDVNESYYKFSVNKENAVRCGMGAIKGVGKPAVETIIINRKKEGHFKSIFDMAKRIDLRAANKKAFESLAYAGAFDSFPDTHRAQYFQTTDGDLSFLEKVVKFAARYQESKNSAQVSLFGEASDVQIPEPEVPPCEEWPTMKKLKEEKEVVGIFISGHPLDDFKTEIKHFTNAKLSIFREVEKYLNRELSVAGVVTDVMHNVGKNGQGYGKFTLEDYDESHDFWLFGEDYLKLRHFLVVDQFIYVKFRNKSFIDKKTGEPGKPRTNIIHIKPLQNILEEMVKKMILQVDIHQLNEDKINYLDELFNAHKGKHQVNFVVYEATQKIKVNMPSKKRKVNVCTELLDEIQKLNISFKLN
ncbi:DNA polymerase III subunit alpha [Psychroflexus maritimus]|uniref:DNA polymerase III subunit alpha n=1 Tax=Psychroflexus maritimus TaxID=2714865 RepID=A0A967AF69_9FLAO|nr:DNA polymerase III subunit alpha [Psychroflexus maritimus]NGZ90640.1 DNA polymerase III subunit alpha [Psychroflexus maritimus]